MTTQKTLLIDAGNSYLKWTLLSNGEISKLNSLVYPEETNSNFLQAFLKKEALDCNEVFIVSVKKNEFIQAIQKAAQSLDLKVNVIKSSRKLADITNAYNDPETLGTDRLVAMVGAYSLLRSKTPCIVVDSGTATTIDAIDNNGNHLGGIIFPGYELSEKSLLRNTDLLPQLNDKSKTTLSSIFAKDTSQAISSGCLLSNSAAIEGICSAMEEEMKSHLILNDTSIPRFICGGGASKLLPFLKNDGYTHEEKLLMIGLKRIKELGVNGE